VLFKNATTMTRRDMVIQLFYSTVHTNYRETAKIFTLNPKYVYNTVILHGRMILKEFQQYILNKLSASLFLYFVYLRLDIYV
jgi:hypothetical protein